MIKKNSKKKKKKRKGSNMPQAKLQSRLRKYFETNPKKKLNAKQLIQKLKLLNSKDSVHSALVELENQGILYNIVDSKFRLDRQHREMNQVNAKTIVGKIDMIQSGAAYVITDQFEEDIYIPAKKLNFALDNDQVEIKITRQSKSKKPEGVVLNIISRATDKFLGTLKSFRNQHFVYVPGSKRDLDIYVETKHIGEASDGDKVIVQLLPKGRDNKVLWGRIMNNLGNMSENDLEMNAILINQGFNISFPEEVMNEVKAIPEVIPESEIAKRKDIRAIPTFTIDPHDAKDFDDALSYEVLENGNIRIGVHIADVTHYVQPNTPLDKEALFRSTSVYLVDRVCPMLPEKLSNGLCSLRPNEDKLCFSAIFDFTDSGKIIDTWLGRTVIHSDHRFTYEEAQTGIETGDGPFAEELKLLNKFAHILRKDRFKNGSISFETEEVKFKLDDNGFPIGVYLKERKDAHLLVEDFMLLANKAVAVFMAKLDAKNPVPAVYRVHDLPDPDKLSDLALFASEYGLQLNMDTPKNISASLNKLAEAAEHDPSLKMLQPLGIRSMAKAEYTSNNIGHFGLAFEHYTHFTSPIRRYSDVLVHRLLEMNLNGIKRAPAEALEEQCKHISQQERKAMDAERESIKYKQVEYMMDKVGETFDGFISGIIDRGFFVELEESHAEGLVSFETTGESFTFQDHKAKVTGDKSGNELKMGDKIKVKLYEADLEKRRLEFRLVKSKKN